ncbi:MAG: cytochrome C oxidase subunit IV family protein [Gemmatimonadota bacterium]
MASHAATHDEHAHATSNKYIQIAVVLFVLTALEVLLYEACFGHLKASFPGLASSLGPYFVELLLILSAFKFWLVAMFYMHLKFDMKALSWVFGFSLLIAAVVILALVALFTYNRTLWWFTGKW